MGTPTGAPRLHCLYVAADDAAALATALASPASLIQLDLEDGVREASKAKARQAAREFLASNEELRSKVLLRINRIGGEHWLADIEATCEVASAYLAPQISRPDELRELDAALGEAERGLGLPAGSRRIHIVIETARGFSNLDALLDASPRIAGIVFGQADFTLDVGCEGIDEHGFAPSPVVEWAHARILLACAGRDLLTLVGAWLPPGDAAAQIRELRRLFAFGYEGAVVARPELIEVVEAAYRPTEAQISFATGVVDAYAAAAEDGDSGVTTYQGWLVEGAFVRIAERLLARASARA